MSPSLKMIRFTASNEKLSCRRETARCFVFVCSQLQHTYSAVFYYQLLRLQIHYSESEAAVTAVAAVHKIILWLGYPMVKKFRRYPSFLFSIETPLWQSRKTLHK